MEKEKEDVTRCDLCGSVERNTVFVERGFPLVRCEGCGLVYVTPRFTQVKIKRLFDAFSKGDREGIRSETGLAPPWEEESPREKERYEECLHFLRRRLPSERRRLLDVGAGNGNLVLRAKDMGFAPFAFDVMPEHIERLGREHGIEGVVAPRLVEANLPSESFDAVTLWDVLEHLPRPTANLQEIHRVMRPGGMLTMKTPNYDWLMLKARLVSRLSGLHVLQEAKVVTEFGLFAPEVHLYNFTVKTLKRLLGKCGFEVMRIRLGKSSEPSSRLSLVLHDLVTYTARGLYACSLGSLNLNPSLTVFAVKR
jgi:2-polyprenyl-3-methyl-5-hydroxy-6-metoxy-1,4-benzoquinol methylase